MRGKSGSANDVFTAKRGWAFLQPVLKDVKFFWVCCVDFYLQQGVIRAKVCLILTLPFISGQLLFSCQPEPNSVLSWAYQPWLLQAGPANTYTIIPDPHMAITT